jgi:hypothetical protein
MDYREEELVYIRFRVNKNISTPLLIGTFSSETRQNNSLSLSLSLPNAQTGQRRETTDSV